MDIAVVNLTRFGDLLQSQAVVDDLHAAGHNVHLVCLENFAPAARYLRQVRQVWPLPGALLLQETSSAWRRAFGRLQDFAARVRAETTHVLNLTPGTAPRLLTRMLAQGQTYGLDLDNLGFALDHGVWASFVSVAARKRANSPFNLADLWRLMALPLSGSLRGSSRLRPPPEDCVSWAARLLDAHNIDAQGYVAFQLGASESRRRWPVSHFRQLGRILWREGRICPVLLGHAGERDLAERYATDSDHPFVDAVGQTSLEQLGALLRQMRLLVTNDTGTMHLASGLGIPSLAFFLATAQPWDTGPMLPGCCCLEPALNCHPCPFGTKCGQGEACRGRISPDTASHLVLHWLNTGIWNAENIDDARVWVTDADADGMYQLRPCSHNAWSGPGAWHAWWRRFWGQLFDNMEDPSVVNPGSFAGLPAVNGASCVPALAQGATLLRAIADVAESMDRNSAALGKIFLRNCERLQDIWDNCEGLSSLSAFWREFRANQGADLTRFGQQCRIMGAHVQTLGQALPVS